jgi:HPt (histidine-containing phosphotransfer) domain-containing protein
MPSHAIRAFEAHAVTKVHEPMSDGAHLPPIDLVHLSRQSLGDRALELELLTLFERQAEQIAARLATLPAAGERRWRHDLAHTLKGSARAVGATAVAAAAQAYEEALDGAGESAVTASRDALLAAVTQARSAVLELLGEG